MNWNYYFLAVLSYKGRSNKPFFVEKNKLDRFSFENPLKPFLTNGMYYKPMTIVNDDSRVINKLETSLTDDARVVIYDHHMFIVQAASDKPCHVLNSKYRLVSPGDVRLARESLANDERTSLFGRKH
jgi:hypothetical protein